MLPPPPSSPLFPYTTLFRSLLDDLVGRDRQVRRHRRRVAGAGDGARHDDLASRSHPVRSSHWLHDAEDRKSTRLNSSHSSISYAVFCLKKKKKITRTVTNTK